MSNFCVSRPDGFVQENTEQDNGVTFRMSSPTSVVTLTIASVKSVDSMTDEEKTATKQSIAYMLFLLRDAYEEFACQST